MMKYAYNIISIRFCKMFQKPLHFVKIKGLFLLEIYKRKIAFRKLMFFEQGIQFKLQFPKISIILLPVI